MKFNDKLKDIIKEGKWIKNDIGMGRVQCSKIIRENTEPELTVFIVSDNLENPICTNIEKVLIINDQLILFYDGQYTVPLEKNKYEEYKKYLTEKEWNAMFSVDSVQKLQGENMISEEEGYYLEIHETIEKFMQRGYDEEATYEISEEFNLR